MFSIAIKTVEKIKVVEKLGSPIKKLTKLAVLIINKSFQRLLYL